MLLAVPPVAAPPVAVPPAAQPPAPPAPPLAVEVSPQGLGALGRNGKRNGY